MKKYDCPLCKKEKVITYTESKMVTRVRPAPKGTMGNYTRSREGGGYDFKHAQKCPKLKLAYHKEKLLEYHFMAEQGNHPQAISSDFHTFEDYQKIFEEKNFLIKIESVRKHANVHGRSSVPQFKWKSLIYIEYESFPGEQFLETEEDNPDTAFDWFRHRLLCGELIVKPITPTKNRTFQLKSTGKVIELVELKNT